MRKHEPVNFPFDAQLTRDGLITVPKHIRDKLNLKRGDSLFVRVEGVIRGGKKGNTGLKNDENQHGSDDP